MSNIVISEAPNWSEEETQRNLETLERMGMETEIDEVKKLRASAKRKGELTDSPEPHLAGAESEAQAKKGS